MTQQACLFELFSSLLTEIVVLLSQRKQISEHDELMRKRRKVTKSVGSRACAWL
jgi:hypothetical protein